MEWTAGADGVEERQPRSLPRRPGQDRQLMTKQEILGHEGIAVAHVDFSLLPGDADEYIITSGAFKGQRGFFTRDESGNVVGVDLAGRLFNRFR